MKPWPEVYFPYSVLNKSLIPWKHEVSDRDKTFASQTNAIGILR